MILLTICGLLIFYLIAILYNRRKNAIYLATKFTMPPVLPIIGHLLDFPADAHGKFIVINKFIKNYGKNTIILKPFYEIALMVSDARDVEVLLANANSKTAKKADDYKFLESWLGTGLLTAFGEKWFQRRKIITPGFHFSILEQFMNIFNQQSDIFIKKLESKVGEGEFNIYNPTTIFALDVICETAMGISVNAQSQSQPDSEYVRAVKEITLLLQQQFFSILKMFPIFYNLTQNGRRKKELIKVMHAFTTDVITKRRTFIINHPEEYENDKKKNFLDILLHATISGKPLSDEDIREEVDTFMFEGHDTTTSGISFAIYELSRNQDVQQRVYEELCEVFEYDKPIKVTFQKINTLKYLDMVLKECLRLNPPVPFMGRNIQEPITIGGVTVPAGTNVTICVYSMHHDPDYFPDPEKFDPNRFDLNSTNLPHPFAYIPFSAGARNCIGQKFAMLEMKSVLAKILMNFKILPTGKTASVQLQSDLILKSANGIHIKLEHRNKK